MMTMYKLRKQLFVAVFFVSGANCFSQDAAPPLEVKINFDGTNMIVENPAIPNNIDLKLNFDVPNPATDYSFSYKLKTGADIPLINPDIQGTNVFFNLSRKDFNKPGEDEITFKITKNSDSLTKTVKGTITTSSLAKRNIVDDAIALNNGRDDEQLIMDILAYYSNATTPLDNNTVQTLIENNPYLKEMFSTTLVTRPNSFFDVRNVSVNMKSVLIQNNTSITVSNSGSLGKFDVTKYANAMADIMIEHAKQELTIAFFNRFKKFIDEHEEFRILFPKTTEKLENLLSYKYPEMIKALRVVFQEDIKQIAFRIDDVLSLTKYQELAKKHPQITLIIRSLRLLHQLETGNLNASDVLQQLSNFNTWYTTSSPLVSNIGSSLKVANLMNESISHDVDGKLKWHDSKHLFKLFEDHDLFMLYMGLLYEKANVSAISFTKKNGTTITFAQVLANQKDKIIFFQNKIQEFVDLTTEVKLVENEINDKRTKKIAITNDDRNNYISTSIDVIEYALSIYTLFDEESKIPGNIVATLRLSNDIYKNIYEEKYNAAISNTLDLFEKISSFSKETITFTETDIENYKTKIDQLLPAVANNEAKKNLKKIAEKLKEPSKVDVEDITYLYNKIQDAELLKVKSNNSLDNMLHLVQKLKPYALFMANIVEAKDEKEIKAALDAVILPVGSSSIKKNSDFNFNVQSYLGARLSFTNPKTNVQNTWNDKFALSAPIGLSISYGLNKNWGAISLFVPIFDLGAIVDYKLKYENEGTSNESVESKDYTIKLGQIFSPGAYLVYGFGANIPLSLGFGGQYGPGLSKIDENNTTEVSNPYWKWNIFLSVDIPLFNLSNKAKIK